MSRGVQCKAPSRRRTDLARAYHEHPIFRLSSIGRPVDARYPSNKAVLLLMLVALLAGIGWGWFEGLALTAVLLLSLIHI